MQATQQSLTVSTTLSSWSPAQPSVVEDTNSAATKVKHSLASNYYAILSPPPCQVEAEAINDSNVTIERGKGSVTFRLPTDHQNRNKANRTALRVSEASTYRWVTELLAAISDYKSQRTYLLDDKELQRGVLDGSIPSAVVDSGATSSVGTPTDPFAKTGQQSNKVFRLPNGATEEAREIGELATNVRAPARDVHITPGITEMSLMSTAKFSDAGYTTWSPAQPSYGDGKNREQMIYFGSHSFPLYATTTPKPETILVK